jgi:hypothetical protein
MANIIITPSSGIIDFYPESTKVGRIDGSGNLFNITNPSGYIALSSSGLSINKSSPFATIHAYSASSGAALLNLEGTNGSLFTVIDSSGALISANNDDGFPVFEVFRDGKIVAGRVGQNDFVLTSGGKIGIGTSTPSSTLQISGLITSNSGNFTNSLTVNNNTVWHSGNFDSNNIVRTTGSQSINGIKSFDSQPVFNNGILVGGYSRFTIAGTALDFSIDRGNLNEGFSGDILKFDVDDDNGTGYATTLKSNAPLQNIIVRLPNTSGTLVLDKVNIIAGSGLAGGGNLSADRTFNIGQGDGVTVSADTIAINNTVIRTTGNQTINGNIIANSGMFNTIYTTGSISNETGSSQLYLNNPSGNRIDFNGSGIGPPNFTTNRSLGTKIILSPNISSTQTEFALGMEAGAMWFSVPVAASRAFKWYAGTANIATLFGNGTLDIYGSTSQINVDSLRLDNNVLSATTSNSDLILRPNGDGSLLADTSGNARGIYSNDFQRVRTSISGVAAGSYNVICGGSDNRTANSYSTIGGGQTNIASNTLSTVCGGDLNTAGGNRSTVCGGGSNTASVQSATVGGGSNNQATGTYSTVPGGFRAKATRHGELSHAAGFFNAVGDAQHTILVARRLTSDDTESALTLTGLAPDPATNLLIIPARTTWTFTIQISAYNNNDNTAAGWNIRGCIRRNANNVTTMVGSNIVESWSESTMSNCVVSVIEDNTNEALQINVTGLTGKNIRWVATVDISQVSYGAP